MDYSKYLSEQSKARQPSPSKIFYPKTEKIERLFTVLVFSFFPCIVRALQPFLHDPNIVWIDFLLCEKDIYFVM